MTAEVPAAPLADRELALGMVAMANWVLDHTFMAKKAVRPTQRAVVTTTLRRTALKTGMLLWLRLWQLKWAPQTRPLPRSKL